MLRFARRVEHIAESIDRDPDLLKVLPELRQAKDGSGDPARHHIEGDEPSDRQIAGDHCLRAHVQYGYCRQLRCQLNQVIAPVC